MLSPSPCHPACPPPPKLYLSSFLLWCIQKDLVWLPILPPTPPFFVPCTVLPQPRRSLLYFFFWPTPTILQASADQHLPLEASPDAPVPSSVSQFSELCFFLLHICSPHWIGDQFHGDPRECEARAGPCSSWLTYPSALYRAWPIVAAVNIY